MNSKDERTMRSLMEKLDRLQSKGQVELTSEEAELYQIDTMDELPEEDHVESNNHLRYGD
ncbi:hypothetical protein SAMN04488057_11278 [Cyclobacterium lianum]|uniref:Uncharacterized protein n=1 Tax=Cyclobacterium lianum TaxID=388280 RepID=A0A1M7PZN6_9BACT|nr:hypothetical protein [Cyclobacterium lianum]SHN23234.1 hypothetical protein SAMN04488057_11278 [Cyclobacterium lianum]